MKGNERKVLLFVAFLSHLVPSNTDGEYNAVSEPTISSSQFLVMYRPPSSSNYKIKNVPFQMILAECLKLKPKYFQDK